MFRVEGGAGREHLGDVRLCPFPHGAQRHEEGAAELCEFVLDVRRVLVEYGSRDQTSSSSDRRVSARTFGVMPWIRVARAVNRSGPCSRALTMNTVQRAPIRCSTTRDGQVAD